MKVGIVLSDAPGYSETFFRNKIKLLITENVDVVLFVDKLKEEFEQCKVKQSFQFRPKSINDILSNIKLLLNGLIYLRKVFHLIILNHKDGFSIQKNFHSILISLHILDHQLDWLHFGFGTAAIGRENVSKAINSKMAVSFRGFDIGIYPIKFPGCYDLLWSHTDKVHVISEDILKLVLGYSNNKKLKIEKINPAIDTSFFQKNHKTTLSNQLILLTVARLNWKKGIDYTLYALYILKQSGIDFIYNLVGEGKEVERLKFLAYQLGIYKNVKFLGKLRQDKIRILMAEANIYLQYSVQEGFCNSVLEAQAMGKICIVSDAEGLSENVENGKSGWVIPKRNPELLAEKIKMVFLESLDAKEEMSAYAASRVRSIFNLENQKEKFIRFYSDLT